MRPFRKPGTDELAKTLHTSHSSFETPCGAYGHFKITRYLMRVTGDSTYGDSMEAVLYNTILGAKPIRPDGVSFYYADYNNDGHKFYYDEKWPCCSGTFPQLTADYGISSYFRAPKGVYVNLFVPSRVTWRQGNARVTLSQETQYPTVGETSLLLKMDRAERFLLALRVPAWAGRQTVVRVNGRPAGIAIQPGTWAEVDREWKDGDRIEFTIDMPLRLFPLDAEHPSQVALLHGPVALFAIDPGSRKFTRQQLLEAQKLSANSGEFEVATDQGKVRMKPYPAINDEHYRLYQET